MKIAVTGVSGYAGAMLLPLLFKDDEITEVVGLDVRPPAVSHPKLKYVEADVRDPGIAPHFAGADVIVHLAFIVTEIKDKKKIYDINVNGTKNVLAAVKGSGARKLVVASSVCAYGSHADNPPLITEETPLRGNKESYYSHTKQIVEGLLDEFERDMPGMIVTRLRPSIFCGRNNNNFFRDVLKFKIIVFPAENPDGLPIVHEDDVGEAFYLAVKNDAPGAFNICAGSVSVKEMGRILGKPTLGVPYLILKPLTDFAYAVGAGSFSSHWTVLGRYPFNASIEKAARELGWRPKHTVVDAFKEMVEAQK